MVARTARRHKLFSEAAKRWERGVDPAAGAGRAGAGGRAAGPSTAAAPSTSGCSTSTTSCRRAPITLRRRPARPGWPASSYPPTRVAALLDARSAATVTAAGDGTARRSTPPTWRPDLTDPADLVEEVRPARRVRQGAQRAADRAARQRAHPAPAAPPHGRPGAGRGRATSRCSSYPFVSPALADALGLPRRRPAPHAVRLANPLSERGAAAAHHAAAAAARRRCGATSAGASATWRCSSWALVFLPATGAGAPPAMGVDRPPDRRGVRRGRRRRAAPAVARRRGAGRRARAGRLVGCRAAPPAGPTRSRRPAIVLRRGRRAGRPSTVRAAGTRRGTRAAAPRSLVGRHGRRARRRAAPGRAAPALRAAPAHLRDGARPGRAAAARRRPPAPAISSFPPALIDVALVVDAAVPGRRGARRRWARAPATLLEAVRLFDVYTGDAARRGPQVPGVQADLPGARPDAHRRGGGGRPGRRRPDRRRPRRRHPPRRLTLRGA